jgi:methionyl-tRNA synthetase
VFGYDSDVAVESFHERYERELGNDLGNLLSRTTALIAKYRGGTISVAPTPGEEDKVDALREGVAAKLDVYDIGGAVEEIWQYIRSLNRYVTQEKPWELAKDEAAADHLDRVLYALVDGLRVAAVALHAYLPETTPRILAALGQPEDFAWDRVAYGLTSGADGIDAAPPLFPRVEAPAAAA